MIPQETIDKIIQASSIVDVVSEFVSLKKRGVNYIGCCPFHSEKTPSFTVSQSKGIYKCFGCGKGGNNAIDFIQAHENLTFIESVKWLGKKYGIEVEQKDLSPEEKAHADERESLKLVHEWGVGYFHSNIDNPEVKKYLLERQQGSAIIEKFKLGFAISSWNDLLENARKKGFKESFLLDSSLIGRNEKNAYDYFRNRVIFPFLDLSGNVIGFTGRILEATEKDAKYLNSKDTKLFSKGKALFGLYQAKQAIIKEDECYLVEGNFDVTSFHQAGIENTVCGSGTAFTIDQIRLIRRFTNNITIIYDGDIAGIKASFKSIDLMLGEDINVRAIALPTGDDPDSFARRKTSKELADYIEDHRKDFITFKQEILKAETDKDPLKEADFIRELLTSISLIRDPVTRDMYKRLCIEKFKIDVKLVDKTIRNIKHKEPSQENIKSGWIYLDWATEPIREQDEVFITLDLELMYRKWDEGIENTISYRGNLTFSQIQELNSLTHNLNLLDSIDLIYTEDNKLTDQIQFCKQLYNFKFNLKVNADDEKYVSETISFMEHYFYLTGKFINANLYDQELRNKAIEDAAELLSGSDNTNINVNTKTYAGKLGIKEADFKKVMKPFLEKNKSRYALQNEVFEEAENMRFEPDRLPEYVDQQFYARWGYFPYQNSKGDKVRYVFRTQEGGLQVIGNFYIEPLFHIKDPDPNKNKRVIKINNAEQCRSNYVEMNSSAMIDFAMFKKVLFNEGGNIFTKGKSNNHETILASIAKDFPECWELNVFGQQHEGFWAFTNAIFADNKITYVDDLGLAPFKDKTYYSPAFSKIFSGLRQDNDKFENDRFFVYRENNETTFAEWAKLMDDVYKLSDNGKWAILFSLMAAFRSIIYPIDRLFTSLFFIGPTESGKSQIAISIRSLYMKPDAPLFNLNSGTDAAFFTTLERYRDVPVVYEEYNDYQISDIKFQGLKAAVYDGEGKQKRKDATSKDLDITKVNAVPVLLGQEGPERDDGSLGNRCIICHVPKKDDWSENESIWFRLLKEKEKAGLSNVLLEVLKQRDIISNNFQKIQRAVFKQLKDDLTKSGMPHQTRILNTVSLFAAMCKLWEVHVPSLKLPFTYKTFHDIAKAKIIAQSEAINSTNRVSVFFDTIVFLLNRPNGIKPGKEFKIEKLSKITVMENRNETAERNFSEKKILFLRINILHAMYQDVRKTESLKLNNLMNYLKDHVSYIGTVKSTRFSWTEIEEQFDPIEKRVTKIAREATANTSALALDYELLEDMIDLEKYGDGTPQIAVDYGPADESQIKMDFNNNGNGNKDDLPF